MPGVVRMVAIDPGEVHCGVSCWVGDALYDAFEVDPPGLYGRLVHWLGSVTKSIDEIVVEEFRLYPWMAEQQGFTELKTVEVIGVIQYLGDLGGVEVVRQPAMIKVPTFAIMQKRHDKHGEGVLPPEGKGQHVKDAVAHGYYRRNKGTIRLPKEPTKRSNV